jgi:hypothetical protein
MASVISKVRLKECTPMVGAVVYITIAKTVDGGRFKKSCDYFGN